MQVTVEEQQAREIKDIFQKIWGSQTTFENIAKQVSFKIMLWKDWATVIREQRNCIAAMLYRCMSMKKSGADISISDPFDGSPLLPINFLNLKQISNFGLHKLPEIPFFNWQVPMLLNYVNELN